MSEGGLIMGLKKLTSNFIGPWQERTSDQDKKSNSFFSEERQFWFNLIKHYYVDIHNVELIPYQYIDAFVPPVELVSQIQTANKAVPDVYFSTSYQTIISYLDDLSRHNIDTKQFGTILDFGCGLARLAVHFLPFKTSVYACDINSDAIQYAKKKYPEINFSVSTQHPPLEYEDGTFDFVFANSVFTHILYDHQSAWIDEVARVMKKNAIAIISVVNPNVQMVNMTPSEFRKGLIDGKYFEWGSNADSNATDIFIAFNELKKLWGRDFEILDFSEQFKDQSHLVLKRL